MEAILETAKVIILCGISAIFFQIGLFFFVITIGHGYGVPSFPAK